MDEAVIDCEVAQITNLENELHLQGSLNTVNEGLELLIAADLSCQPLLVDSLVATAPESRRRRDDIDGLRAVSILAVLFFHMNPSWCPGGFAGVDIFFVISGFVVTTSLLHHQEESCLEFVTGFLARRATRLLPGFLAVVPLSAWTIMKVIPQFLNQDAKTYLQVASASTFGSANVWLYLTANSYWDPEKEGTQSDPFLHLWSLGVEEQFYLLSPWLLFSSLGKGCWPSELRLWVVLVLASVTSLVTCWRWTVSMPDAAFYLLPARFWELATGAMLALLSRQRGLGLFSATCLQVVGLLLLAASLLTLKASSPSFPFPGALLPTSAAALLIAAGTGEQRGLNWLLATSPFTYLGRLSYPLYLWHMPLLALWHWTTVTHDLSPQWANGLLALVPLVACGLAALVYHCMELPAQELQLSTCAVLAFSVGALAATWGWLQVLWLTRTAQMDPWIENTIVVIALIVGMASGLRRLSELSCVRSMPKTSMLLLLAAFLLLAAGAGSWPLLHGSTELHGSLGRGSHGSLLKGTVVPASAPGDGQASSKHAQDVERNHVLRDGRTSSVVHGGHVVPGAAAPTPCRYEAEKDHGAHLTKAGKFSNGGATNMLLKEAEKDHKILVPKLAVPGEQFSAALDAVPGATNGSNSSGTVSEPAPGQSSAPSSNTSQVNSPGPSAASPQGKSLAQADPSASSLQTSSTTTTESSTLPSSCRSACACRPGAALHAPPCATNEPTSPLCYEDKVSLNVPSYQDVSWIPPDSHIYPCDQSGLSLETVTQCLGNRTADAPVFITLGDSKAFALLPAIVKVLRPEVFRSRVWTSDTEPQAQENLPAALRSVLKPGDVVLFAKIHCQEPSPCFAASSSSPSEFDFNFGSRFPGSADGRTFNSWYKDFLNLIYEAVVAADATLLLAPSNPVVGYRGSVTKENAECQAKSCYDVWAEKLNASHVKVLNYWQPLCTEETCDAMIPGTKLLVGNDAAAHLLLGAAEYLAPFLCSQLDNLGLGHFLRK